MKQLTKVVKGRVVINNKVWDNMTKKDWMEIQMNMTVGLDNPYEQDCSVRKVKKLKENV